MKKYLLIFFLFLSKEIFSLIIVNGTNELIGVHEHFYDINYPFMRKKILDSQKAYEIEICYCYSHPTEWPEKSNNFKGADGFLKEIQFFYDFDFNCEKFKKEYCKYNCRNFLPDQFDDLILYFYQVNFADAQEVIKDSFNGNLSNSLLDIIVNYFANSTDPIYLIKEISKEELKKLNIPIERKESHYEDECGCYIAGDCTIL